MKTLTDREFAKRILNFSPAGAVCQMVIMNALTKDADAVHLGGETNERVVLRLMARDRRTATPRRTLDAIRAYCDAVTQAARAEVQRQFDEAGTARMINPAAWSLACEHISAEFVKRDVKDAA